MGTHSATQKTETGPCGSLCGDAVGPAQGLESTLQNGGCGSQVVQEAEILQLPTHRAPPAPPTGGVGKPVAVTRKAQKSSFQTEPLGERRQSRWVGMAGRLPLQQVPEGPVGTHCSRSVSSGVPSAPLVLHIAVPGGLGSARHAAHLCCREERSHWASGAAQTLSPTLTQNLTPVVDRQGDSQFLRSA